MKNACLILFAILPWTLSCNYDELYSSFREAKEKSAYGNWCGPGRSGPAAPVDSLDSLCMAHDNCYDSIPDPSYNYWDCVPGAKTACDTALVNSLISLGSDPSLWAVPPADFTAAEIYREDAIRVFEPCVDLSSQF